MGISFLSLAEVVAIHEDMIYRYGGARGLRDVRLLESAVGMPQATFGGEYLHDGIPAMAAAYCFHVVGNHPFLDGNKRTGVASANVFLEMNGWTLDADNDTCADLVLGVASSRIDKRTAITFFQARAEPRAQ